VNDDSLDFENQPFQAIYFFNELPSLDAATLAHLFDEMDPTDEEKAVVEGPLQETTDTGGSLQAFEMSIGEIKAALALHPAPSPHLFPIRISGLDEEEVANLLEHRCIAMATVEGGEEYLPVEKVIVLLKLAAVLQEHGALGAHFLQSGLVLGSERMSMLNSFAKNPLLDGMLENTAERLEQLKATDDPMAANLMELLQGFQQQLGALSDEELKEANVWNGLRQAGEPSDLLIKIELIPGSVCKMEPDDRVVVTHGCAQFGYPDIYYVSTDPEEDLEDVWMMLGHLFSSMMSSMVAMQPGTDISMSEDDPPSFSLEVPDEAFELPWEHGELLELMRA
jgi:hypothetical protein